MAEVSTNSLCLYLDGLVDELRRRVPEAMQAFDEDAVHKSRVATRRLKAAMDLLEPVVSADQRKPFLKVTRNLRRRLGPLRDLDVMIGHLARLRSAKHASAVGWVRQRLEDERQEARKWIAEKADPSATLGKLGAWWGLREQVREAEPAVPALLAESLHLQLDAFAERAAAVGRSEPGTPNPATQNDPHELRIAGKRLRYTLEIAAATGHALEKSLFKSFKKMQDALGVWHDFVVLSERVIVSGLEGELHLHNPQLKLQLLELAKMTLSRAQRDLAKFSTLWEQGGEAITAAIREAFPLTGADETAEPSEQGAEPVSESETDRDRSDSDEPSTREDDREGAAPAA